MCSQKKIQFTTIASNIFIFLNFFLSIMYIWQFLIFKTLEYAQKICISNFQFYCLIEKTYNNSLTFQNKSNMNKFMLVCGGIEPKFQSTFCNCSTSSLPHPHPTQNTNLAQPHKINHHQLLILQKSYVLQLNYNSFMPNTFLLSSIA